MNQTPPPTLESELLSGLYTDEEKAQILGQIEDAASANRLTVDAQAFRPKKRGILFPILVNVVAVGLIVGAWFGASAYFQTKQEGLRLRTDRLFSTESKLLTKVLEDSKNQLAAKNAEIEKIQGEMARLATEKADLQKSFATRVADREKTLRKELADAIAAERVRLQEAGYGAAEVERRLKDFEARKVAEFNTKLADYRRQVQAEIDQRSLAVTALQTKLQTTVSEQEQLRKTIESQTKERERDLQSQLSSQAANLDQLQRERDELAAFARVADPAAADVRAAFDAGDTERTQAALTTLRQILARASGSPSEAVRSRAQSQGALAAALDGAVTALSAGPGRAGTEAASEALRAQLKKERDLSAMQQSETQQALAAAEARTKQAAAENEALKRSMNDALTRLQDAGTSAADARAEADRLAQQVADLTPYKTRSDALKTLFAQDYPTARERFQATFGSEPGLAMFPDFPPAWQELENLLEGAGTASTIRRQAYRDVLTFAQYLQGTSPSAQAAKDATEKLARTDDTYRQVVETVQALAAAGGKEAAVSTVKTMLYGTVTGVTPEKITLEPLTKVRPQEGQTIELRRVSGRKEVILGQGTVTAASDKKIEVTWAADAPVPQSGDPAYLVLP